MRTYYITPEIDEKTNLDQDKMVNNLQCNCGQSYGYLYEDDQCKIIVCNSCYENSSYQEKFYLNN